MRRRLHAIATAVGVSVLGLACSTTIAGQDNVSPSPDASVLSPATDAKSLVQADAEPQVVPCVEGDVQVTGVDGTCYLFFSTPLDWSASQAACLSLGATLVTVLDQAEQAIVGPLAANAAQGNPDVWLGASDLQVENTFVWVDNSVMLFNIWRSGEPNNNGGSGAQEDCAVIEGDNPAFEWDDRQCSSLHPYICERAP